jgi:immune inhibitor A
MKHKPSSWLIALLMLPLFTATAVFAMPPHPTLLEKIRNGEIAEPYFLKNAGQLRQKGIDAPWTAPGLILRRLSASPKALTRSFGPLLAPSSSWKALLILVDFTDNDSQVNASFFDDLIFGTGVATLRDYYRAVSYNHLDIVTVNLNLPSSLGWNREPQTYAYYVDGQNGFGNYPRNAQKMVEDACDLVDTSVDFAQYDNDGDGYVDALFVVHAGPGAEFTGSDSDIWSHSWTTSTPQLHDGVYVSNYSMEPEYWLTPGDMTIGVYAHELGHTAFGLPDLYDTTYQSEGLGNWSLMAGGSWNGSGYPGGNYPALPDAWSHFQMGYVNPVNVAGKLTGQTIKNIENNPEAYRLWTSGAAGDEYFLLENRRQIGYDSYLPGNGLLIYHIDESVSGNNNPWYPGHTSFGHYEVALEQADGLWGLEKNASSGDDGDPYPGSANNRNLTFLTLPDSKGYGGGNTHVKVENISASGSTMNADLNVLFHTINASAGPHGIISPSGTVTVDDGDTTAFTITPDSKYHLAGLLLDGTPSDTGNGTRTSYIFAPVTTNHTIAATFAANPSSGGGGGGGGGGGVVGPLAVGISALLGWWKRRKNSQKGKLL